MSFPVLASVSDGAERTTPGTTTLTKLNCTAGNLIVFHFFVAGDTADWGTSNTINISDLDGTELSMNSLINSGNIQILLGRVTANGTCSRDITCGASGEDVAARFYEFSGVAYGNNQSDVVENDALTGQNSEAGFTTSTTVSDSDVTTNGPFRLALNFVHLRTNQALGSFTGETGGDWAEAIAEYRATALTLQLQTANMASAGVIDGGTMTVSNTYWQTAGTALIPSDTSPNLYKPRIGWPGMVRG